MVEPVSRILHSLHVGISWATEGAGGSGRVFEDLWRHLPEVGIEFRGAVAAPRNVSQLTHGSVQCFASAGGGFVGGLLGARRVIQQELLHHKPDLIASHFALYVAPALDLLKHQPHVVHFHGPWGAESAEEGESTLAARTKCSLEQVVYRRADRVIVLSRAFAKIAEELYGIAPERIRIVPGAVDLDRFGLAVSRQQARQQLGWPHDRPVLITVRRLVRRMGIGNLLTAMKEVCAQNPSVLLYIAGKGRLRQQLERQIAAQGLQHSIKMLGFVSNDDLPLMYRAADLMVVPTLSLEGFGLVAAESLAAGTPCLVTPVGGLPEVVSDLSPELVFESSQPHHLAQGVLRALDGTLSLPSETACRQYAQEHFGATLMAKRTAEVYRELA